MLQIQGLTKYYSKKRAANPAIDNVSFSVNDGEIVGFVGLNGAGKTTTIRIASGVSLPSSGRVIVDGYDIVKDKTRASKYIGWVPEYPNFEQNAKALSLMLYFAGFHNIKDGEARKRTREIFEQVGLSGSERKELRTYSQGMKKRFSLALALLPDPKNFLFDEILNGLDPEGIHLMRSLIGTLKNKGRAVLLSSHILSEIESIADKVVFIHKGKIIQVLTRDELSKIEIGSQVLRIVLENLDNNALGYLRSKGEARTEGHNTVFLSNFTVEPTEISTELVRRGFLVREFSLERSNLEEYFFKLVGVTPSSLSASLGKTTT